MSKSDKGEFQDPKIILTTSILRQRDGIVAQINAGRNADAFIGMATLLSQLYIEDSEKELLKARRELTENAKRSYLPSVKVMDYFQLMNNYLNCTYFTDYHKARPKFEQKGQI